MSNITIACICLAVFSVCTVICGVLLIVLEVKERKDDHLEGEVQDADRD